METISFSRIGKEDLNLGTGTFEVTLADGRKVILNQVDIGALLNDRTISTQTIRYSDSNGQVLHAIGSASD